MLAMKSVTVELAAVVANATMDLFPQLLALKVRVLVPRPNFQL